MQYPRSAALPVSTVPPAGGALWLKLAVVYLIVGVAMGIAMGAMQSFQLRPVHAHTNLLGWATAGLAGLIYAVYPAAGASRLARYHFWLHNTSVPVMMASLSAVLLGRLEALPVLVASEFVAAAGVLVFAWNVVRNVGDASAQVREASLREAAKPA
jgi:hypothetical protein